MTVSAICSLSLDPPLVLVCVDRAATMHPHLESAGHFAVNILAAGQEELSRRFANIRSDRFEGVVSTKGETGVPLLDGALAHLECAMWAQHDGGDHTIFVGRVHRAAVGDSQPLLHYRGSYARIEAGE